MQMPAFFAEAMADPEVAAILTRLIDAELEQDALDAEANQRAIAKANEENPVTRSIDGLGPKVLSMDPTAYLHYKVNEGFDFSSGRDRRWLTNRFPAMKVAEVRTENSVGWVPPASVPPARELVAEPRNVRSTTKFN